MKYKIDKDTDSSNFNSNNHIYSDIPKFNYKICKWRG